MPAGPGRLSCTRLIPVKGITVTICRALSTDSGGTGGQGEGWDRNGRWQGGKEPIGGGHEGETGYVLRYWLPEATLNDFVFGFDIEVRTDACLSYLSVFLRDVFKYSSRCKLQPAP